VPRSSIVSTLPILEAALDLSARTAAEDALLERGADYLIQRRLFRSLSRQGAVIDERWLKPLFPRFYHYDVLRGLHFLVNWAVKNRKSLPLAAVEESVTALKPDELGRIAPERPPNEGETTHCFVDGVWEKRRLANSFRCSKSPAPRDDPPPRSPPSGRRCARAARTGQGWTPFTHEQSNI